MDQIDSKMKEELKSNEIQKREKELAILEDQLASLKEKYDKISENKDHNRTLFEIDKEITKQINSDKLDMNEIRKILENPQLNKIIQQKTEDCVDKSEPHYFCQIQQIIEEILNDIKSTQE
ncbi:hypothetical protein TRFO_41779 [Tritrichomonas foetus]|uniref:Uncharacterized protein n=1 Tax=Tritrichomonas foetus TaxID=1144522 RepID=A0A1J4KZ24_9EUKA|nr:hypothetical protein TRFO_41779 [Tritrichomonas foetus]|eukprot:OHT16507.1 hypothetical protein TRFO_41779 [Tritrichomonas foetus]